MHDNGNLKRHQVTHHLEPTNKISKTTKNMSVNYTSDVIDFKTWLITFLKSTKSC